MYSPIFVIKATGGHWNLCVTTNKNIVIDTLRITAIEHPDMSIHIDIYQDGKFAYFTDKDTNHITVTYDPREDTYTYPSPWPYTWEFEELGTEK